MRSATKENQRTALEVFEKFEGELEYMKENSRVL